ncbi:unnamed protein product [Effrenium voratum]|nr:unnamed protein product [Effrenium voratum]
MPKTSSVFGHGFSGVAKLTMSVPSPSGIDCDLCFQGEFLSSAWEAEKPHHPGLVVKAMEGMGASWTMANLMAEEAAGIALRVFLLDNSGSTQSPDGHVLQSDPHYQASRVLVPASRWDEIAAMALDQAEWNAASGVRCEFVLLNPPSSSPQEGRDYVTIDAALGNTKSQVAQLAQLLKKNPPRGATPLAARLRQIAARLRREVKDGGRIMLSVVTDGIPTSHLHDAKSEFMQELRKFASEFNTFMVIRLATDENDVVDYYNRIDEELELPLDILDDLAGEAKELKDCGNGWFAYTPLLHRIREGGTLAKLFDLLDERRLQLPEIAQLLELLFRGPEDPPFPRNASELYTLAEAKCYASATVFNGRCQRMTLPLDLKELKKALGLTTAQRIRKHILRALCCSGNLPP